MQPSAEVSQPATSVRPPGPPPVDTFARRVRHYAPMMLDPIGAVTRRFEQYGDVYFVRG